MYTDFTKLTPTVLGEFIGKIIIHKVNKSSSERKQDADVYPNFISKFDVPLLESTPKKMKLKKRAIGTETAAR